jgi:TonB-dependent SusC/RagA subfamily outer membrane receptor
MGIMKNYFLSILLALVLFSCQSLNHRNSRMPRENTQEINDGYSKQGSANYTGAADVVNNNNNENLTLDVYLRRLSGISVNGQGASATVTVRGINSFAASTEPLFILNGMALNGGFGTAYNAINPNEIKSVTVLKDASSTGLYGSRGANGVIVITLKNKANSLN